MEKNETRVISNVQEEKTKNDVAHNPKSYVVLEDHHKNH